MRLGHPARASRLARQRREWDDLGLLDPYWAILSRRTAKHGKWERSAFFATGESQVERSLAVADSLELPANRNEALDFGCGLGRLTRALAQRFIHVKGVDLSPSLISQASALNAGVVNCEFLVTDDGSLSMFDDRSVDFVYSLRVLQHQTSRDQVRSCISEFVRVLRPDGLAIFQVPTHVPPLRRVQPRRRLYALLRTAGVSPTLLYRTLNLAPIPMTFMPKNEVIDEVENAGGKIVTIAEDQLAGVLPSATYYITGRRI